MQKNDRTTQTINTYDPRLPRDRMLDSHAVQELHNSINNCLPNSTFFLNNEHLED